MLPDPELQKHYEDLFTMYATPGWKALQGQIAEMFESHNTLAGLTTADDLHFRRGQLDVISYLVAHQDQHERAYNQIIADMNGVEPEVTTGGVARVVEDFADADPDVA